MLRNERGIALALVLLVAITVAALAMGGIVLTSTGALTSKFHYRELALHAAAEAGIELARDSLNRDRGLLPDSGYVTLESNAAVYDASGSVIPGVTRSVYAGRTGGRTGGAATSGQYGTNFASALSVIEDARGAVAVRRMLLNEESWSRYAYAMNRWSNAGIHFACGEIVAGAVHSNASVYILCRGMPKPVFMGPVAAVGGIADKSDASFQAGYTEGAQSVRWPDATDLARLRSYAQDAGADYDINGSVAAATSFTPATHIEFVTVDLDDSGVIESNEGFFKVFQADVADDSVTAYVSARRWPTLPAGHGSTADHDPNLISLNCGAVAQLDGAGEARFRTASEVWNGTTGSATAKRTAVRNLLTSGTRRCYPGGDPHLFPALTADTLTPDSAATYAGTNLRGKWLRRSDGLSVPATLIAKRPGDHRYFFPLQSNVNFKGVIYVRGPVSLSGRLRGRVTVATTGNVMLIDDLLYTQSPGTDCSETGDLLGVTTPEVVAIADNNIQNPFRVGGNPTGLFDDTPDNENYHMFIFSLKQFYGENVANNPSTYDAPAPIPGERCAANPNAKSGCVRVSGGIIQEDVVAPTFTSASGWAEQHTYDKCGLTTPPPYFPTTGRYLQNRLYEIDPVWLNQLGIAQFFRILQGS